MSQEAPAATVAPLRRFESLDETTDRELVRTIDYTYYRWRIVKPEAYEANPAGAVALESLARIDEDMRDIGRTIAGTYDITYPDIKIITASIFQNHQIEPFGRIEGARSWMHARLGEGLHDGGSDSVVGDILTEPRFHPLYRAQLEAYVASKH